MILNWQRTATIVDIDLVIADTKLKAVTLGRIIAMTVATTISDLSMMHTEIEPEPKPETEPRCYSWVAICQLLVITLDIYRKRDDDALQLQQSCDKLNLLCHGAFGSG